MISNVVLAWVYAILQLPAVQRLNEKEHITRSTWREKYVHLQNMLPGQLVWVQRPAGIWKPLAPYFSWTYVVFCSRRTEHG